jgi:hypothetical protein
VGKRAVRVHVMQQRANNRRQHAMHIVTYRARQLHGQQEEESEAGDDPHPRGAKPL